MTVSVLWPFLTVPWVGLQCVIVVFPDHARLFFLLYNAHVLIFPNAVNERRMRNILSNS